MRRHSPSAETSVLPVRPLRAALCVLFLAACGTEADSSTSADEVNAATAAVTIQWGHRLDCGVIKGFYYTAPEVVDGAELGATRLTLRMPAVKAPTRITKIAYSVSEPFGNESDLPHGAFLLVGKGDIPPETPELTWDVPARPTATIAANATNEERDAARRRVVELEVPADRELVVGPEDRLFIGIDLRKAQTPRSFRIDECWDGYEGPHRRFVTSNDNAPLQWVTDPGWPNWAPDFRAFGTTVTSGNSSSKKN